MEAIERRNALVRRGRGMEYFTIGWNVVEAAIAIGAGLLAGSPALVGFGVDSSIESLSGFVLLWRLHEGERGEAREKQALQLVGVSFLLLALYVTYEAATALLRRESPEASYIGIALGVVSVIVMPLLAHAKRRVAVEMQSKALQADSRQTDICAYLSVIMLAGLGLNALFGWWWADPVAALVMVPIIAKEATQALRGETCDDCHS